MRKSLQKPDIPSESNLNGKEAVAAAAGGSRDSVVATVVR
jgi:hypothetical protein